MDYLDEQQVWIMSNEIVEKSKRYAEARNLAALNKWKLDLILASKMNELRKTRSNLGYEMARIMLLEEPNEETKKYYREEERYTAEYKGLEKIIDALHGQVILAQSLIKNRKQENV
jgi:hypothetical protein